MPYKIFSDNGKSCVHKVNADGSKGELVKCHDNKDMALAHMRALWANVKDSAIQEFSMSIVKATSKNGEMRWRSVNSDVAEDVFGERMSLELFSDFNKHILNDEPIPDPFRDAICEDDWCGGMPYMSIAHYKSGAAKINVPGEVEKVYVDGKALKSTGKLFDTPLGRAVYKSLEKDLTEKSAMPVRVSIGFLDLEHSHGDKFTFTRKALRENCPLCKEGIGDKIYKKGHLVHLALTRVPANPRTEMELEQKSMITKLQDAKSIIEDEEVVETLDLKSTAEELVIKAKKTEEPDDESVEAQADAETPTKKKKVEKSVEENTVVTPFDKSLASLKERMGAIKSQGLTGDAALAELQKNFDELGTVVKAEFIVPPSPEEVMKQNLAEIVRSTIQEMLPQALSQIAPNQAKMEAMQSELVELRALTQKTPIKKEEIPTQRSLNVNLVQKAAIEKLVNKAKSQFDDIARASVGLQ